MIGLNAVISRSDMIRCALCDQAPCDTACDKIKPASLLRSIWFGNEQTAAQCLPEENPCITCPGSCEQVCVRPGEVPIRDLINRLYYQVKKQCETPVPENEDRLKCDLYGIPLENPFLLSSSVVASTYDKASAMRPFFLPTSSPQTLRPGGDSHTFSCRSGSPRPDPKRGPRLDTTTKGGAQILLYSLACVNMSKIDAIGLSDYFTISPLHAIVRS